MHEVVDHVGEHQHGAGEDRRHQHRQDDPAQRARAARRRDPVRPPRTACRWWPAAPARAPRDRTSWKVTRPTTWAVVPSVNGTASDRDHEQQRDRQQRLGDHERQTASACSRPAGSRPRQRSMPIANITPSGTVISGGDHAELEGLEQRGVQARVVPHRRSRSPQYHRIEKPCQMVRDLPSLNENSTAISTGSSDQTR